MYPVPFYQDRTMLLVQSDKALRLVSSDGRQVRLSSHQLTVPWEVRLVAGHTDAALQAGLLLVVEGHNVPIQNVGQAIEFRNLQGFGPQLDDVAVGFHDDHTEGEHFDVRLRHGEPDSKELTESLCVLLLSIDTNVFTGEKHGKVFG